MRTELAVTVSPRGSATPIVVVSVPGQTVTVSLQKPQRLEFVFDHSVGWLEVCLTNKPELDPDMAVQIDCVEFFGIADPRFVWAGVYSPIYPQPWLSQQHPEPPVHLYKQTYLGWNGTWRLDFSIPVFSWMHQQLGLGWLYQ